MPSYEGINCNVVDCQSLVVEDTKRVQRQNFTVVAAALILARIADAESTFASLEHGAQEGNPVMQGVIEKGRPATYAVYGVVTTYQLWRARRDQRRHDRHWYLSPLVSTFMHGTAAGFNLRFVW